MFRPTPCAGRRRPGGAPSPLLAVLALAGLAPPVCCGPARPEVLTADDACAPGADGSEDASCSLNALQAQSRARRAGAGGSHAAAAQGPPAELAALAGGTLAGVSATISKTLEEAGPWPSHRHEFKIIGAGFPKTGTSSLKVALERLGYHPVHGEMLDLNQYSKIWEPWTENDDPWPAINTMLDMGYDAALDRPWCWTYKELLSLHPKTKVILTEYPNSGAAGWPEAMFDWNPVPGNITGFIDEVWGDTPGSTLSKYGFKRYMDCEMAKNRTEDNLQRCRQGYIKWYDEVKAFVPPKQLLVYSVTEGWEPLCRFLEVKDCPTEPFPHVHVAAMVVKELASTLQHWHDHGDEPPPLPVPGMWGRR